MHYLALLGVGGLIFLTSHLPPKVVNLDDLIGLLAGIETVLVAPRRLLLWAWPGETVPDGFPAVTSLLNSLVWGGSLALIRHGWRTVRRR